MVESIKMLKDEILKQIEKDRTEKGVQRIDPEMVDMVKDLACAEKDCWEAEYYRTVSEQMGQSGYMGYMPDGMRQGYQGDQGRSGWQNQYGSGYRRGYGMSGHQDAVEGVRNILAMATPEEKERIRAEMRSM